MAIGDAALAAGMDLVNGASTQANTIDDEINKTRDYIAQKTSAVLPIAKGGTGSTNASAARSALGIPAIAPGNSSAPNAIPTYNASNQLTTADPTLGGHAASKGYVDARPAPTSGTDLTLSGHLYVPNSSVATSGWTTAYINVDGRLSRGASSERYKKFISAVSPEDEGDLFPQLHRFQMRGGDGSWQLGYIAERLDENDDQQRFVIHNAEGAPESIDFIQLLLAQVAQLNARLTALEAAP